MNILTSVASTTNTTGFETETEEDTKIRINRTKDLYRTDSIRFTFTNGKIIFLYGFIVIPRYVGYNNKNFVECETEYCKINEKDSCYIGQGISF